MCAGWKKVQEVHPHILAAGCSSHGLALVLKDTIKLDTIKGISDGVLVIKCLKNKRVNKATFKAKQADHTDLKRISLKLPNKTRVWGATAIMFKSLLVNKIIAQETAIDPNTDVSREVKDLFFSDEFWSELETFYQIVKPISQCIKLVV